MTTTTPPIEDSQQAGRLRRLVLALRGLLENPFPHDMINLRRIAGTYATESEAREDMPEWCSQKFCDEAVADHIAARKEAEAALGQND